MWSYRPFLGRELCFLRSPAGSQSTGPGGSGGRENSQRTQTQACKNSMCFRGSTYDNFWKVFVNLLYKVEKVVNLREGRESNMLIFFIIRGLSCLVWSGEEETWQIVVMSDYYITSLSQFETCGWASHLLRDRGSELFVQFDDDAQAYQHVLLTFNL